MEQELNTCDYCGAEFDPKDSLADDSETYCSVGCEIDDTAYDDYDEDDYYEEEGD
jgi:hypothetical protein